MKKIIGSLFAFMLIFTACKTSPNMMVTPNVPTWTRSPESTEQNAPTVAPVEETAESITYAANLTSGENWSRHPYLTISNGELIFSPTDFEQVWARDFSETLGD